MEDGHEETRVEGAVRYFRLNIMRIQSAIAKSPTGQKLVARTSTGVETLERPAVSKLIDMAYVERMQVITDKLVVKKSGGTILVKHIKGHNGMNIMDV